MAGTLTVRLCQEDQDEARNIALNPFCEALFSVLGTYHTIAQVKNFYNMTAEDQTQMDSIVSQVMAYPQKVDRTIAVHRIRSILTFWEQGDVPSYMSVDDIDTHLNAL